MFLYRIVCGSWRRYGLKIRSITYGPRFSARSLQNTMLGHPMLALFNSWTGQHPDEKKFAWTKSSHFGKVSVIMDCSILWYNWAFWASRWWYYCMSLSFPLMSGHAWHPHQNYFFIIEQFSTYGFENSRDKEYRRSILWNKHVLSDGVDSYFGVKIPNAEK